MTRIVFMGSPQEVVAPLSKILDEGFNVIGVVSQPARPSGRGGKLLDPPVAAFAKERSLKVWQPEKARDPSFLEELKAIQPDIIVTAAYGQILSDAFLVIPRIATINIHPSLLPKYRGATPVPAALLDGLKETGVTILFTVKALDAGNIILQEKYAVLPNETSGELTARMFAESGPMLVKVLRLLEEDPKFVGQSQDESQVTFCKKIAKEDGVIDWSADSSAILNRFRAYHPWPGSFTGHADKRVVVTSLVDTKQEKHLAVGEFTFDKSERALLVGTADRCVAVRSLKPAGSKEMDAASFWNGLKDKSNNQFTNVSL